MGRLRHFLVSWRTVSFSFQKYRIDMDTIELQAPTSLTQKLKLIGEVSNSFFFSEYSIYMDTIELHAPTSSTQNRIDMDTIELHAPTNSTLLY